MKTYPQGWQGFGRFTDGNWREGCIVAADENGYRFEANEAKILKLHGSQDRAVKRVVWIGKAQASLYLSQSEPKPEKPAESSGATLPAEASALPASSSLI